MNLKESQAKKYQWRIMRSMINPRRHGQFQLDVTEDEYFLPAITRISHLDTVENKKDVINTPKGVDR